MQSTLEAESVTTVSELLVLWQQPSNRAMVPVAILAFDGKSYSFRYLDTAKSLAQFRPLIGFRDFDEIYESDELFALFQERVLDPSRADYASVVQGLALDPLLATPWEQLVRTGGSSEGDTIQVTPFPHSVSDGWECIFLAAGLRYFQEKTVMTDRGESSTYTPERFEEILKSLSPGDALEVVLELDNTYNPHAQLLFYGDDVLGYLPDWLARLTAPWVKAGRPLVGRIVRVNEAGAGWHLRLMVAISSEEPFGTIDARLRDGETLRY